MECKKLFNEIKVFGKVNILNGYDYLSNKIKDVQFLNVPDKTYWISENDLVVLNSDILISEKMSIINIINLLKQKKISALIIINQETDIEIKTKLEQMIKLVDQINFPILEANYDLDYRSILSIIGENNIDSYLINQLKNNLLSLKDSSYYTLTNIILIYSYYIKQSILLLSDNCKILDYIEINRKHNKNIPISYISELINNGSIDRSSTLKPSIYIDKNDKYTIFPLKLYTRLLGYLCLINYDSKSDSKYDLRIANEVIPFIIISMMSYHQNEMIYNKSKDEFVRGILYGLYSDKKIIENECNYFNFKYNLKRFVWLIHIKHLNKSHLNPASSDRIPRKIIDKTLNISKSRFYEDYSICENSTIIFIRLKHDELPNAKLNESYANLLKELEIQMPEYSFSIGISRAYNTIDRLNLAYEDAVFSIKMGLNIFKNVKSIYPYDDLIVYHLLYSIKNNPIIERLYKNSIDKLIKFDKENNTELLKTIKSVINSSYNFNAAADGLFIHRNTLYQRIKKIESITGYNLNNSEARLLFQLGIKIHDIYILSM